MPPPSSAEVSLHSTLLEAAYLACPAVEVSPVACAQGTIHSGRLLIKTMCGVAGPAGGDSGNQAWPGACGYKGWGKGLVTHRSIRLRVHGDRTGTPTPPNTYQWYPELGQAELWETAVLSR